MNRGYAKKIVLVLGLINLFFSCDSSAKKVIRPKYVILISLDTLRADHLSCYGYDRRTSPNIDAWAKKGILFQNTVSQSYSTAPSHMTMLTSTYPSVHGVYVHPKEGTFFAPSSELKALPSILKEHGFSTGAFTGGGQVASEIGFGRGFDIYKENMSWITDKNIEEILNWIITKKNNPFFLFLHTYQIHDPYTPLPPFDELFGGKYTGPIIHDWNLLKLKADEEDYVGLSQIFWGGSSNFDEEGEIIFENFTKADIRHLISLYDGEIAYTDQKLHKMLLGMKELGILQESLVIITSDHGEEFGEHAGFLHKDLYLEDIHVPLIMVGPGCLPRRERIKKQVRLIDLMPTILDILGIEIPAQCQGQSLVPIIEGNAGALPAFSECVFKNIISLRTDDWSCLFLDDHKIQLYDRKKDLFEQSNVAEDYPDLLVEFKKEIESFKKANLALKSFISSGEIHNSKKISAETLEKLKALGYIR